MSDNESSDEENENEDVIDLDNIEDEENEEDDELDNGEIDDEDKDINEDEDGGEEDMMDKNDESCYVKYADQDNSDDDDDVEEVSEEESDIEEANIKQTTNKLTFYERIRCISTRARQLQLGAKPLIKVNVDKDDKNFYKEIARLELEKGVLPIIIERPLPNGTKEKWKITDLTI